MRDFCGKNGCYQADIEDNVEYVNIYLNSVKVLEEDNDQFLNVAADEREVPDIIFELIKEEDSDCMLTTGMEVPAFCADGVNEFIASLVQNSDKIATRDGLYDEVQRLLNLEGAPWGPNEV